MKDILIVYWSGTGNTEQIALLLKEAMEEQGSSVELKHVSEITAEETLKYNKIALGCPAMAEESLEEDEFEPFYEEIYEGLKDKKVCLFGSYGWGEGEWMQTWIERTENIGANLLDDIGLKVFYAPDSETEKEIYEYGVSFSKF